MKPDPLTPDLDLSSTNLQLSCGSPATLDGQMTRPSAAGRQRALVPGGRFSPVAPPPSTLDLTWTTQVDRVTSSTPWRQVPKRQRWLGWSARWSAPRTQTCACPFGTTCSGHTLAHCTSSSASRQLRDRLTSCCGPSAVTKATAGGKVVSLCPAPTNPIR